MGTVGNQNPWAPYESYRDCSQGICNIYCPQWCYFFPPPPPHELGDDSGTAFSPLIIAVISILASAFLLVSYYTIITKYCSRRNDRRAITELETNRDQIVHDQLQVGVTGLDETIIKSITVCKYIKGDGLIEGTECAVCLNEFQENENLRLLPKCTHAFHLPCIDTWLKTHSNCPLCRSSAAPISPPRPPPPVPSSQTSSSSSNISSLQIQRQSDLVLVIEDCERVHHEVVDYHIQDDLTIENPEIRSNVAGNDQENDIRHRRSMSLSTFLPERDRSIAEILRTDEDDELQGEIHQSGMGIGSSGNCPDEQSKSEPIRGRVEMKRSVSTGRLIVTYDDKGKNAIVSQLKIEI